MKTAIVTGASGFIGSNLVKNLIRHNIAVQAIVREKGKNTIDSPLVSYIECDLKDYETLNMKVHPADVLYHFAWCGVSNEQSSQYQIQLLNIKATLDLINGPKFFSKFIGAGSLHEIECLREFQDNTKIKNPGMMYKSAKLNAHIMAKTLCNIKDIPFIWPIITNTYGVGEKSARLVNTLIRQLLKSESPEVTKADQLYDFIYIDDLVEAFYLLGMYGKDNTEYTIGSGNVLPLKDYLEEIRISVNPQVNMGYGKKIFSGIYLPRESYAIDNLVNDTGFKPAISFLEGIRLTTEWIKQTEYN